jgi:hypothetical protein
MHCWHQGQDKSSGAGVSRDTRDGTFPSRRSSAEDIGLARMMASSTST